MTGHTAFSLISENMDQVTWAHVYNNFILAWNRIPSHSPFVLCEIQNIWIEYLRLQSLSKDIATNRLIDWYPHCWFNFRLNCLIWKTKTIEIVECSLHSVYSTSLKPNHWSLLTPGEAHSSLIPQWGFQATAPMAELHSQTCLSGCLAASAYDCRPSQELLWSYAGNMELDMAGWESLVGCSGRESPLLSLSLSLSLTLSHPLSLSLSFARSLDLLA